ncbi:alpha/beta-hydrolase [Acephala macrosclerotiorum]|nr:alpha/beta-hydrolase [Acephala macrosclerotiorum]
MADIKPYTIHVPDEKLQRLRKKLELTDFPQHEIEGAGWKYGVPLKDIKSLHGYWLNEYDWRKEEEKLNELPNFTTKIGVDGYGELEIHFLHDGQDRKGAIPLLFVHGWPGSFLEVTKMLPLLRGGDGKPSFVVVAPSLPNYAFSERVKKQGFEIKHYAEACHKLMLKLGYNQYGKFSPFELTQGGDWGFLITRALAHLYPQHVKATHTNWCFASPPQWTKDNPEPEYSDREKAALARAQDWWVGDGRGYLAIQSSKPATIAFSHADSPIALLAWIYEKLSSWSDDYPWTPNEILTWVSLYYFSRAGPEASSYHYYEALHGQVIKVGVVQSYIDVLLGLADFPVEISNAPKSWWGTLGPVVWSESYGKGGHFAGWERPEDVVEGLCKMFGKGGGAEGVVEGRSGYADGSGKL